MCYMLTPLVLLQQVKKKNMRNCQKWIILQNQILKSSEQSGEFQRNFYEKCIL